MKIRVKLYALLGKYLPPGAVKNEIDMEVEDNATIGDVLNILNVPEEECHLVLVNGTYVAPSERAAHTLMGADALAIWPPVAGG